MTRRAQAAQWFEVEGTLNSRLAMIELPDSDDHAVRLGSLWLAQPAVLVFLRHYG